MKEIEVDKYIGKCVEITSYGRAERGTLYKIVDHKCCINGITELHPFKSGYFLKCLVFDGMFRGIAYRKSHIQKIRNI